MVRLPADHAEQILALKARHDLPREDMPAFDPIKLETIPFGGRPIPRCARERIAVTAFRDLAVLPAGRTERRTNRRRQALPALLLIVFFHI